MIGRGTLWYTEEVRSLNQIEREENIQKQVLQCVVTTANVPTVKTTQENQGLVLDTASWLENSVHTSLIIPNPQLKPSLDSGKCDANRNLD